MEMCAVRRVRIPIDDDCMGGQTPADPTPSVLLVTDDGDLRVAGARVLGLEGYRVVTAAHSGHALLACLTATRPFDVLMTELAADDMSGPALAERLRRHQPALRTIYLADAGTPGCDGTVVRQA